MYSMRVSDIRVLLISLNGFSPARCLLPKQRMRKPYGISVGISSTVPRSNKVLATLSRQNVSFVENWLELGFNLVYFVMHGFVYR